MKRFLVKLISYATITLIIFSVADIFLSRKLRNSTILEFQAWNNIYNQELRNNVVIMGSSRAFVQFNPRIIDSVLHVNSYNLGYNASLVNRQVERYYAYCRIQNWEPETIIYSIDYGTLSGISVNFEREQFYPYFFYDRNLMEAFDKYQHFSLLEKYVPFWRYCTCFLDFHFYDVLTNPEEKELFYKGFKNNRMKWGDDLVIGTDPLEYTCSEEALLIFKNFIKDMYSKGKNVIFVYAPLYTEFFKTFKGIDKMYTVFGDIAHEYDIPILDYSHDTICNDTSYFYNSAHLNKIGADRFTLQLSNDLRRMKLVN